MASPNTTFVSGAILTAAQMNNLPFGSVGAAVDITSLSQTGITTVVDITGATISFTAVSGRKYKATYTISASANANATGINILITDATPTTSQQAVYNLAVSGEQQNLTGVFYFTAASSGTLLRKLRAQRQYGTGSITITASSGLALQFQIEDVGS